MGEMGFSSASGSRWPTGYGLSPAAFARRRAQAGEAVEHFEFGFAAREVDALTGQSEELAHVRKIQMAVQSA